MNLKAIFDVAQTGYTEWWVPTIGLAGVMIGAIMVSRPTLASKLFTPFSNSRRQKIVAWFILLFSMFWVVAAYIGTYSQYRDAATSLKNGDFHIVEGTISNFVAEDAHNKRESFDVGTKRFWYSAFLITPGFRVTQLEGSPIRDGLYVRISYIDNLILRLEVAQ